MQDDVSLSNIVLHYFYKLFLLNFLSPNINILLKSNRYSSLLVMIGFTLDNGT